MNGPIASPIYGKPLDPRMKWGYRIHKDFPIIDDVIPAGWDWDGATIPKFGWSIVGGPFHPHVIAASAGHDWRYWCRYLPRKEADDLFLDDLKEWGCNIVSRNIMHKAVRTFGGFFYKRTEIDIEYARTFARARIAKGLDVNFLRHFPEINPDEL